MPPVSHQAALIVQSKDYLGGYPALIICSIFFFKKMKKQERMTS